VPLSDELRRRTMEWLDGQAGKRDALIDTASRQAHYDGDFDVGQIDRTKPTALLAANLIWDLSALNRQAVFGDMIEWIAETIRWFEVHPQYQLIVKPHPAELHPSIPATRELVRETLADRGVKIPANVFLLSPTVKLTVYDFLPFCQAGITHTTTVGMEMVVRGIPVIATGRSPYRGFGFTLDPSTREEYFVLLQEALDGRYKSRLGEWSEKALQLTAFYMFHYYIRLGLTENKWGENPRLLIDSADVLRPGRNVALDYVCDSILSSLPIVGADRWPPMS
jgi:hypothetical protein